MKTLILLVLLPLLFVEDVDADKQQCLAAGTCGSATCNKGCTELGGTCKTRIGNGEASCPDANEQHWNRGCWSSSCTCCLDKTKCVTQKCEEQLAGKCGVYTSSSPCNGGAVSGSNYCRGSPTSGTCQCCVPNDPACVDNGECNKKGGFCYQKTNMTVCDNGGSEIEWHKGCGGKDCSCCILSPSATECIEKPFCYKDKGSCSKATSCPAGKTLIVNGCHGTGCICCK